MTQRDPTTEAVERLLLSVDILLDIARIPQPDAAKDAALAQFNDAVSGFAEQVLSGASIQSASSAVALHRMVSKRLDDHETRIVSLETFQRNEVNSQRAALLSELGRVQTIDDKLGVHFDYVSNMVHAAMIQPLAFKSLVTTVEKLHAMVEDLCTKLETATGGQAACEAEA